MTAGFDRITDVHIHIQPWRELKPAVLDVMWRGAAAAERDRMIQLMEDPRALLEVMDGAGVWRVGLVNYPSPDIMGVTDATNAFAARYARANPERLLPYGGVHPRYTKDPAGDVDPLVGLGVPPRQNPPPPPRVPPRPLVGVLPAPARSGRPGSLGHGLAEPGCEGHAAEHRSVRRAAAQRRAPKGHPRDQCAGSVSCCSLTPIRSRRRRLPSHSGSISRA